MADKYTPEARSLIMSRVRSTDTKPEMVVRKWLHSQGLRFRLHRKDLPGKPDIVLPRFKTVILVNGCFWHQHQGCRKAALPASNRDFWAEKLGRNVERDNENKKKLIDLGWRIVEVWECELKQKSNFVSSDLLALVQENTKKLQSDEGHSHSEPTQPSGGV